MVELRKLTELIDLTDPAWPLVQSWISDAQNDVEVLAPDIAVRDQALLSSQVTTHSSLGAVIYETGGLLVDHGWVRVLGSGSPRLPRAIHNWNLGRSFCETSPSPPFYLVADDVAGGFFALNGGAFGSDRGNVYYHAPDSLTWEPLEMGYSAFLQWLFTPNLGEWASDLRWPGWQQEAASMPGDRAVLFVPFLFTKEGSPTTSHRGLVPLAELYSLYVCDVQTTLDHSRSDA
jgi:hypothetical protein